MNEHSRQVKGKKTEYKYKMSLKSEDDVSDIAAMIKQKYDFV